MFTTIRGYVFAVGFVAVVATGLAQAQSTGRSQRLSALQQQNAVIQQRNAVQTAAQQTTALVQGAYLQNAATSPIDFQLQQNALRDALQQTSSLRQNGAAVQTNTLQNALQQSIALQTASQEQSGVLTGPQLQMLSQMQSNLMGLLLTRPQPLTTRRPGP